MSTETITVWLDARDDPEARGPDGVFPSDMLREIGKLMSEAKPAGFSSFGRIRVRLSDVCYGTSRQYEVIVPTMAAFPIGPDSVAELLKLLRERMPHVC